MKKTAFPLALLLTVLLLLSLFSGCGETEPSEQNLIKQQVIYDKDGIKITAKAYGDSKTLRDFAEFSIENHSDTAIITTVSSSTANRYMINAPFYEEVGAGATVNAKAVFDADALRLAGITDIGQMTFFLAIDDTDTLETIGKCEAFSVSLPDFDESAVKTWENGRELFSRDGIRLSVFCVKEKGEMGLIFFTENKSGRDIFLCTQGFSVDGKPISGIYAEVLQNGTMARSEFLNFDGLLRSAGVTDPQEVTLSFQVSERVPPISEGIPSYSATTINTFHSLLFLTDPITFPFAP